MKITNPEVIKNGEKDLIEAVQQDLDLNAVKTILLKKISAAALRSNGGKIVVHENEIAFQLDFDIQLNGSLLFDRQGNHIPETEETEETEDLDGSISKDLDLDNIHITDDLEPDLESDFEPDEPLPLSDDIKEEEIIQDGLGDEDITDILKESQDFWDQKKETP